MFHPPSARPPRPRIPTLSLPESTHRAALRSGPASLRERWLSHLDERGSYPRWVLFAALAGMFATTFPITILTISLSSIAPS